MPDHINQLGPVALDWGTALPDGAGRTESGQIYGPGMAVWTAVNCARRIWSRVGTEDDGLLTRRVRVYEYGDPAGDVRRVLFSRSWPGQPDVDLLPACPLCGWACRDSAHDSVALPLLLDFPTWNNR